MKHKHHKNPSIVSSRLIAVGLIITLLWLIVLTALTAMNMQRLQRIDDALMRTMISQSYHDAKLDFCLTNDLKPCDNVSIKQWNAIHPVEDQFPVQDSY